MKRTKKAAAVAAAPKRSEIITNCVIYAQSMAAYHAGFKVDSTDGSDHAGQALGKKHFRKADRAVARLIGLSPACLEGRPPLSRDELFAKAGVLSIMTGANNEFDQTPTEKAFVRFFAAEVEQYLRAGQGST